MLESGEEISDDELSDLGGLHDASSDSCASEVDVCTCGAETQAHKRGCPLSSRSGRTLFPPPSSSGASALPSALEPDVGPKDSVRLPPSREVKSQMKVGDHVCVHKRNMGSCHLPCRIIGEFGGRYQLYCSKGVLNTSFCGTELIPLASCSPIPLENWRLSPKISLRSVVSDPALVECCDCQVPVCSDGIVISLGSEEVNEAADVWVDNGAYRLTHRDQEVVLSQTGWLTDEIICAAQMLLLQFFPNMEGLQPPTLQ